MLWNWNVIDSCFIAQSWHVKTKAMFAGSCIGVVLLVMLLEFFRRAVKEYDRYLIRQQVAKSEAPIRDGASSSGSKNGDRIVACTANPPFRPSVLQQAVRSLLHTCQFVVAYFVMLYVLFWA
jgi:copper transporter 1